MARGMETFATGDVIELGGHGAGAPSRLGEILEVVGEPGHMHYRVLWEDNRESILYPAADARLHLRRSPSVECSVELRDTVQA